MQESSTWGRAFSANHTEKPFVRGATEYIVTAPFPSIGIALMGVLEFLPLEVNTLPISMKNGRALVGRITIHPQQLPDTGADVPDMHGADFFFFYLSRQCFIL